MSGFSYPLIFLPFISSAFVPTDGHAGPGAVVRRAPAGHARSSTPSATCIAEQPVGSEGWIAVAWCVGLLVVAYALAMRTYRAAIA